MKLYQVIELLNEKLLSTTDERQYRTLDEAVNCLVNVQVKFEEIDETLLEIGNLASVYKDLEESGQTLREALRDICALTDTQAMSIEA